MKTITTLLLFYGILFMANAQNNENKNESKSLLIVLDVQSYYTQAMPEEDRKTFISNINRCIEKAESQNMEVIYVKTPVKALSISLKGIKAVMIENSYELDKQLKVINDQIFVKHTGNIFGNEDFIEFAKNKSFKTVYMTGLYAEKCVFNSSLAGKEDGYTIKLISEALAYKKPNKKDKIHQKYKENNMELIDQL